MIIISHRGNLEGPNIEKENKPEYIDAAIQAGYPVEVDLRSTNESFWLGHDTPQYQITSDWLYERKENLWIHIKDCQTAIAMSQKVDEYRFFCHQQDDFTLTSNGYVWVHDLTNDVDERCIIPLIDKESVLKYDQRICYAVCSDYVFLCERN